VLLWLNLMSGSCANSWPLTLLAYHSRPLAGRILSRLRSVGDSRNVFPWLRHSTMSVNTPALAGGHDARPAPSPRRSMRGLPSLVLGACLGQRRFVRWKYLALVFGDGGQNVDGQPVGLGISQAMKSRRSPSDLR